MNLSSDLIARFVKATKDDKKTKGESTVYGTTVEANGSMYVRIDGANTLTPVIATTDVVAGERVIVMIKNHTATITGNITSPASRAGDTANVGEAALNAAAVAVAAAAQAVEASNKASNAEKLATNFIEHNTETNEVLVGNKVGGAFAGFKTKLTESLYAILNVNNSALLSVSDTLVIIGNKNTNVTIKDVGFGNTDISDLGDGTITGAIKAASRTGSGEGGSGVGVESIIQTTKSTDDDGVNIITATLTDGTKSTFEIQNGSKGSKGDTGATGPKGDKGDKGDTGATGPEGPKGDKGDKGDAGETGPEGPKGDKGDTGSQGPKGDKGDTGVGVRSVEQTTTSSEPGGTNTISFTLTDGTVKTFNVKNGLGTAKNVEISLVDYERLSDADKNDENIVYFIPDGEADELESKLTFNYKTPTLHSYNCTGDITASQTRMSCSVNSRLVQICGRIIISNFVRTSSNPGVYIDLPFLSNETLSFCCGHRIGTDREVVMVNVNRGSNMLLINTSETYVNATNGTLTLIIPLMTICIP